MAAMRALVVRCSFLTDGSWYCSRNAACSGVIEIIGESPQLGVADKLLVVVDARTSRVGTRGTGGKEVEEVNEVKKVTSGWLNSPVAAAFRGGRFLRVRSTREQLARPKGIHPLFWGNSAESAGATGDRC